MISIFKKNNFIKKYVVSWLLPLIFFFVYNYYDNLVTLIIFIYSILNGLFYFNINYVRFSDEHMLYGNTKRIKISEIENLYIINQKSWLFYVFKTNSPHFFEKYIVAEHKGIGFKDLIKPQDFKDNYDQFIDIIEYKSNVPKHRIEKLFY